MASLFRSEEMTLCQLYLQSESAYLCLSELGELGLVQFRDLNPDVNAFQRKFVNEVRRCDEMERKIRYMEHEIKKDGITAIDNGDNPDAPQPREMVELETTLEKLENELREVNLNSEKLKNNLLELIELKHVLKKAQMFFDEQEDILHNSETMTRSLISNESRGGNVESQLGFIAGVIPRSRLVAFERMLWRSCRGNVFLRQNAIDDSLENPATGELVLKSVFVAFYQGEILKSRVRKICEGFRATIYPCPESAVERRVMAIDLLTRMEDLKIILGQTQDHKHRVMVAASVNLRKWSIKTQKIKAIYHTLNLFNLDVTQKCLIAECWVPVLDIENIQMALRRGTERSNGSMPAILNQMRSMEEPPTYNRTNKFTSAFQALVDAYGVSSYREMNPAPYTIITFPFLFAVMFGDLGHGLIMAMFAAWMVYREKIFSTRKTDNEIWNIFFGGRYIILLMGLFSMYTGLIYNDMFSKSLNIFGSHWKVNPKELNLEMNLHQLNPNGTDYDQTPYPVGLDPVWQLAPLNKIIFQNAYKMKISIIFGVIHMLFGLIVGFFNYRNFKNRISIYCEFIPQVIFLVSLFVYMTILMFIKWIKYSAANTDTALSEACAPSILITFINMVMFKEPKTIEHSPCSPYMYPGQEYVQKILVIVALICVPWMLIAKPYMIMRERKRAMMNNIIRSESELIESSSSEGNHTAAAHGDDEDMSEIIIHQSIHTIEYVLGCISHTASYLRLWALSLAHAQLADVLWTMVLRKAFTNIPGAFGAVALAPIFAFWAVATVAILVLMEGLSAFLHTLRLHWVEFQSKFYAGRGYPFQPFSFELNFNSEGTDE